MIAKRLKCSVCAVLLLALLIAAAPMAFAAGSSLEITGMEDEFYTGECWYTLYNYKGVAEWGQYYTTGGGILRTAGNGYAFCLQPSTSHGTGTFAPDEGFWNDYSLDARLGVVKAVVYGAPNNGDTSADGLIATQILVWDMITGQRDSSGKLHAGLSQSPFIRNMDSGVVSKYNAILAGLESHNKIPSFASLFSGSAKAIRLTYNARTGLYEGSATDTNNILADYEFTSTLPGLTISRSGNTLRITATESAARQIAQGGLILSATGHYFELTANVALAWSQSDRQTVMTLGPIDPVKAYIRLEVELPEGNLNIIKTTSDGQNLAGWQFNIYSDSACRTLLSGPHTTDAQGRIYAWGLAANQTVYIKEMGHTDPQIQTKYDCESPNPQAVTIQADQTASVTFSNRVKSGGIRIVKTVTGGNGTVEGGGDLAGWVFKITDSQGKEIPGSPFTTGVDGVITADNLLPGKYTIQEVLPEGSAYECLSENPQTVEVKGGETASASFTNRLYAGSITVQKVSASGEPLAGAQFCLEWSEDGAIWEPVESTSAVEKGGSTTPGIVDGCLTSDSAGAVRFEGLHPGLLYRLTETEAPAGFQLLAEAAYEGPLPAEDRALALTVVNSPAFTLPQTGSRLLSRLPLVLTLALGACVGLIFLLRRKK